MLKCCAWSVCVCSFVYILYILLVGWLAIMWLVMVSTPIMAICHFWWCKLKDWKQRRRRHQRSLRYTGDMYDGVLDYHVGGRRCVEGRSRHLWLWFWLIGWGESGCMSATHTPRRSRPPITKSRKKEIRKSVAKASQRSMRNRPWTLTDLAVSRVVLFHVVYNKKKRVSQADRHWTELIDWSLYLLFFYSTCSSSLMSWAVSTRDLNLDSWLFVCRLARSTKVRNIALWQVFLMYPPPLIGFIPFN